jgi:hypothetical protein
MTALIGKEKNSHHALQKINLNLAGMAQLPNAEPVPFVLFFA